MVVLTGGTSGPGNYHTSVETFPATCDVPDLPAWRYGHTTFLTADNPPSLATCGGYSSGFTYTCLTLQITWMSGVVGDLPEVRYRGSSVTIPGHGVYLLGGYSGAPWGPNRDSSAFLAAGRMDWIDGPALPITMDYPCTLALSDSFLAISHRSVLEYHITTGWASNNAWPSLINYRPYQPACAVVGGQVIIAGGTTAGRTATDRTEVINILSKTISYGSKMVIPRQYFHMAGGSRTFALGGRYRDGRKWVYPAEVEELESNTWREVGSLNRTRASNGVATVPLSLICPNLSSCT